MEYCTNLGVSLKWEKNKNSYHSTSFDHLIQVCARNLNKEARSPWRLSRTEQERLVLDLLLEHVEMNKLLLWLFDEWLLLSVAADSLKFATDDASSLL